MNKIKKLKITTIFFFLIIVFPGSHITIINFIELPLLVLNNFMELFYPEKNYLSDVVDFFIVITTTASVLLLFHKKKYFTFLSVICQYLYLYYTFNSEYLNYWLYLLPTSIYIIFSLILIYHLLFEKKEINPKKQTL